MRPRRSRAAVGAVLAPLALTLMPALAPATTYAAGTRAVVRTVVIGHTVKGRAIVARELGDPHASTKVVLLGAMHGNETGPSRVLQRLIDGPRVRGADVWVIRVLNRDGVARHTRQNAHRVDLNRNFPRRWRHATGHYASGPRPASEPETRALMRFLARVRPAYVVSFHQPLHGVGRSGLHRGRAFQRRLARGLHLPVKAFNCSRGCHGTMTEWYNHRFRGVALTVEYGAGMTRRQLRTAPAALLHAVGARR